MGSIETKGHALPALDLPSQESEIFEFVMRIQNGEFHQRRMEILEQNPETYDTLLGYERILGVCMGKKIEPGQQLSVEASEAMRGIMSILFPTSETAQQTSTGIRGIIHKFRSMFRV